MKLYNLKHHAEEVTFRQAVIRGLGRDRGLYFPRHIPPLPDPGSVLSLSFQERSAVILSHMIGEEMPCRLVARLVAQAFDFPLPLVSVRDNIGVLELFHGPTLAFKDFGARFMARCLADFSGGEGITILTATSGDTGAAVAHAFYGLPGIQVKVLYPKDKISPLQEKLFCSLGGNIETLAIEGDFDDCQRLVKAAFDHHEVRHRLNLTSANSINMARLLAQVCYYFEIAAVYSGDDDLVVSVPSGNFGNLTAGLIARKLGAPIKRFVAATNVNDTVPRYLHSANWQPRPTVATASNAMDVSHPNNWPRVMALHNNSLEQVKAVVAGAVLDDDATFDAMCELAADRYVSEPHGAIAYAGLQACLQPGEYGVFLATAHPAKFADTVEAVLQRPVSLPAALEKVRHAPVLSRTMTNGTSAFLRYLLG